MDREKELLNLFEGVNEKIKAIITPTIKDAVFLEGKLDELRKLPLIRVSEKNPSMQKATPASKMYKEFLQQYNNCIRILASFVEIKESEDQDTLLEGIKLIKERYGKL